MILSTRYIVVGNVPNRIYCTSAIRYGSSKSTHVSAPVVNPWMCQRMVPRRHKADVVYLGLKGISWVAPYNGGGAPPTRNMCAQKVQPLP